MKPDWKDSPDWANYLTMDSDGDWWWNEKEPSIYFKHWGSWARTKIAATSNWRDSLQQRP